MFYHVWTTLLIYHMMEWFQQRCPITLILFVHQAMNSLFQHAWTSLSTTMFKLASSKGRSFRVFRVRPWWTTIDESLIYLFNRVFLLRWIKMFLIHCYSSIKINMYQYVITSKFPTGFHWVSKWMYVIWYTFIDWLQYISWIINEFRKNIHLWQRRYKLVNICNFGSIFNLLLACILA